MVVPLIVTPEKHNTVFFAKLMAMDRPSWPRLVDLLHREGWNADPAEVNRIVLRAGSSGGPPSEVDTKPILNNLVNPIQKIHDANSRLVAIIERALRLGHVTIFDISRIDAQTARFVSSIIVKRIFNVNKDNFIKRGGDGLIKATFVLEEAHTVLSGPQHAPSAFVDLAKEGRKYGLGGIFITQQPGSIPAEIISQGDNFFVFHLLSKTDLNSLSRANAHYSDDIITQILNEPIRGKSYMWTSHQPFVIPVRNSRLWGSGLYDTGPEPGRPAERSRPGRHPGGDGRRLCRSEARIHTREIPEGGGEPRCGDRIQDGRAVQDAR